MSQQPNTHAPLQAYSRNGQVHVVVDAATARELANAWAFYHCNSPAPLNRKRWHDDVVRLLTAAAQLSTAPAARLVRMVGVAR